MMKKKNKKKPLSQTISEGWSDFRVKLIVLATIFISFLAVIVLLFMDFQNDTKILKTKADKYETYIDQLLLGKFTSEELKEMNSDELKVAVDMVVAEENTKISNTPKLNDFILPVKDDDYSTKFRLTREPKKRWTQEDLDHFWVELNTLDIKNLEENNFEYLKARLKDVR